MKKMKITLVALYAALLSFLYPMMMAEAAVTCFKKTEYMFSIIEIVVYWRFF